MAKEVTFRCNLCGSKSGDAGKFVGIKFLVGAIGINSATDADNHLCSSCVKQLKEAIGFAER